MDPARRTRMADGIATGIVACLSVEPLSAAKALKRIRLRQGIDGRHRARHRLQAAGRKPASRGGRNAQSVRDAAGLAFPFVGAGPWRLRTSGPAPSWRRRLRAGPFALAAPRKRRGRKARRPPIRSLRTRPENRA